MLKVLFFSACISVLGNSGTIPGDANTLPRVQWSSCTEFPIDDFNFAQGVSALFAGCQDHWILAAGGCNFPNTPAANGGIKKYYQSVYCANSQRDSLTAWKKVGELPCPTAYGVSVSTPQGVICVGGMAPSGSLSTAYQLSWEETKGILTLFPLPSLPCTMDNMAGAMIGDTLYVMGGNVNGCPSSRMYSLVLNAEHNEGWKEHIAFPGNPRIQPTCVVQRRNGEECLFLFGGFAPFYAGQEATLSTTSLCYSPSTGSWQQIATPMVADTAISLGGGVAVPWGESIICMGGVDKTIFLTALQREQLLKQELAKDTPDLLKVNKQKELIQNYLTWTPEKYHFNTYLLMYHPNTDSWTSLGEYEHIARAGAVTVAWNDGFLFINGEIKPGIRTPKIWRGILKVSK